MGSANSLRFTALNHPYERSHRPRLLLKKVAGFIAGGNLRGVLMLDNPSPSVAQVYYRGSNRPRFTRYAPHGNDSPRFKTG